MTRMAARKDTNHRDIVDSLRALFGPDVVQDVAGCAGAGFDILARHAAGHVVLIEIKSPGRKPRLTESEERARAQWGDNWRMVSSLQEALEVLGR